MNRSPWVALEATTDKRQRARELMRRTGMRSRASPTARFDK